MSEKNIKGQLLNVRKKDNLRAQPVKFNEKDPFKYTSAQTAMPTLREAKAVVTKQKSNADQTQENRETKPMESQPVKEEAAIQQKKNYGKVPVPAELPREVEKRKAVVGKNNSTKTIKVPSLLHTQINMLGKFMDETKTYSILNELVDNYVENRLTERQQKQFYFMSEFVQEDK